MDADPPHERHALDYAPGPIRSVAPEPGLFIAGAYVMVAVVAVFFLVISIKAFVAPVSPRESIFALPFGGMAVVVLTLVALALVARSAWAAGALALILCLVGVALSGNLLAETTGQADRRARAVVLAVLAVITVSHVWWWIRLRAWRRALAGGDRA